MAALKIDSALSICGEVKSMNKSKRLFSAFSAVVLSFVLTVGLIPSASASGWASFSPTYSFPNFPSIFGSSTEVQVPPTAFAYNVSYMYNEGDAVAILPDYISSVTYTITLPIAIQFSNQLDIGSYIMMSCRHFYDFRFSSTLGTGNGGNYHLTGFNVVVDDWNDLSNSTYYYITSGSNVSISSYINYIDYLPSHSLMCINTVTLTVTYTFDVSTLTTIVGSIDENYLRTVSPEIFYKNRSLDIWNCRYLDAEEATNENIFNFLTTFSTDVNGFYIDVLDELENVRNSIDDISSEDLAEIIALLENKLGSLNDYANIISNSVGRLAKRSVSGNPIFIDDGAEDVPIEELVVSWSASQSGSGTPSVSNYRPISGLNYLSLTVIGDNDADVYNVNWYSQLGVVYGGQFNFKTGEITVTQIGRILDGSEDWHMSSSAVPFYEYRLGPKVVLGNNACSSFPAGLVSSSNSAVGFYAFNSGNYGYIRLRPGISSITDLASFKSWLAAQYSAGTPVEFFVTLDTPITYQLTPVQVSTFLGVNSFSSSGGNIDLTYYSNSSVLSFLSSIDNYLQSCSSLLSSVVDRIISLDVNVEYIYNFLVSEFTGVNGSLFTLTQSQRDYLNNLEILFNSKVSESTDVLDGLELDLPDIDDLDLDLTRYLDSGAFTSLTRFFGLFTADPLIGVFFVVIPICIFIGYVLHGKKV